MNDGAPFKSILRQGYVPDLDPAKIEHTKRVIRYAEDGHTPLVIVYEHVDADGTQWTMQRNLETGETRMHQLPGGR